MTKNDNNYILSSSELKELLEKVFRNGALSYSKWEGQRDTCWSNVNEDMKEEISSILNDKSAINLTNEEDLEYMTDWIVVENGDMFEGTREQFMDCFFTNADDEEIKDWCFDNDWTLKINNKIIL